MSRSPDPKRRELLDGLYDTWDYPISRRIGLGGCARRNPPPAPRRRSSDRALARSGATPPDSNHDYGYWGRLEGGGPFAVCTVPTMGRGAQN
jgi:hypothetical protein